MNDDVDVGGDGSEDGEFVIECGECGEASYPEDWRPSEDGGAQCPVCGGWSGE